MKKKSAHSSRKRRKSGVPVNLIASSAIMLIGVFIWLLESRLFYHGAGITFITSVLRGLFQKNTSKRMKRILDTIEHSH